MESLMGDDWGIFRQNMGLLKNKVNNDQGETFCEFCEKDKDVFLKACRHNFCRLCLIDEIYFNHDDRGQVKCPLCENLIGFEEIKDLLGDSHDAWLAQIRKIHEKALIARARFEEAARHTKIAALLAADVAFIENFKVFECKTCFEDIQIGHGIILKNCLHRLCKECLIGQVAASDNFDVKCTNYDDNGGCTSTLQEREIRNLVPADVFDKHLEKSLKLYQATAENGYQCKTPDCRGFVEIGEKVRSFTCTICNKVNCVDCEVIHQGKSCDEYKYEISPMRIRETETQNQIKAMIAAGEAMYCPKCGILITKEQGCDFLTCTACKLAICWRTKRPRQPLIKQTGEVIDGCHCNEPGRGRCHPQCGNCH